MIYPIIECRHTYTKMPKIVYVSQRRSFIPLLQYPEMPFLVFTIYTRTQKCPKSCTCVCSWYINKEAESPSFIWSNISVCTKHVERRRTIFFADCPFLNELSYLKQEIIVVILCLLGFCLSAGLLQKFFCLEQESIPDMSLIRTA